MGAGDVGGDDVVVGLDGLSCNSIYIEWFEPNATGFLLDYLELGQVGLGRTTCDVAVVIVGGSVAGADEAIAVGGNLFVDAATLVGAGEGEGLLGGGFGDGVEVVACTVVIRLVVAEEEVAIDPKGNGFCIGLDDRLGIRAGIGQDERRFVPTGFWICVKIGSSLKFNAGDPVVLPVDAADGGAGEDASAVGLDGIAEGIDNAAAHVLAGAVKRESFGVAEEVEVEELHQFPGAENVGGVETGLGEGDEVEVVEALGELAVAPFVEGVLVEAIVGLGNAERDDFFEQFELFELGEIEAPFEQIGRGKRQVNDVPGEGGVAGVENFGVVVRTLGVVGVVFVDDGVEVERSQIIPRIQLL